MTEEQKAEELIDNFAEEIKYQIDNQRVLINVAKQCGLILCDEMLSEIPAEILQQLNGITRVYNNPKYKYWLNVKQLITNL